MDDLVPFVSLDGLAANVGVAKKLIENKEGEILQLEEYAEQLRQEHIAKQAVVHTSMAARREQLKILMQNLDKEETDDITALETLLGQRINPLTERMDLLHREIRSAKEAIAPIRK